MLLSYQHFWSFWGDHGLGYMVPRDHLNPYHERWSKQSACAHDTLDKLQSGPAVHQGGAEFGDRGIKFTTKEGVLKWVASNWNHIRVMAAPSLDYRDYADLRKPQAERNHWRFQCPYCSRVFPKGHPMLLQSPADSQPACTATLPEAPPFGRGAHTGPRGSVD